MPRRAAAKPADEAPIETVGASVVPEETPEQVKPEPISEIVVQKLGDIKEVRTPAVEGYTLLVSPAGVETSVPDSIRSALIESGYTEK